MTRRLGRPRNEVARGQAIRYAEIGGGLLTCDEIAAKVGAHANTVRIWLKAAGAPVARRGKPRGSPSPMRRPERKEAARAMRNRGMSWSAIGTALGVTRQRARQLVAEKYVGEGES